MKRTAAVTAGLAFIILFSGCGTPSLHTATFELTEERNGVIMTDTVSIESEDDVLVGMTEIFSYDMSGTDEDTQSQLAVLFDDAAAEYQQVEGVTCSGIFDDGIYTVSLNIELEKTTISALKRLELLSVTGDADGELSYTMTKERLIQSGYTLISETEG